jgi:hypothetical protein
MPLVSLCAVKPPDTKADAGVAGVAADIALDAEPAATEIGAGVAGTAPSANTGVVEG